MFFCENYRINFTVKNEDRSLVMKTEKECLFFQFRKMAEQKSEERLKLDSRVRKLGFNSNDPEFASIGRRKLLKRLTELEKTKAEQPEEKSDLNTNFEKQISNLKTYFEKQILDLKADFEKQISDLKKQISDMKGISDMHGTILNDIDEKVDILYSTS